MPDDSIADGPASLVINRQLVPSPVDEAERLRRAELFLALPRLVRYDQDLGETFRILAEFLVEHTTAMAAAVSLVRYSDMTTLALGYHNLPPGYLEGMQQARQTSEQGDYLRARAAEEQTYVLRNARQYMLGRPEYTHMRDLIERAEYQTLIGVPFMARPETVGTVFLYYRDDVDVDDTEIAFARAIGEYAKPFMDNAWLFVETERRAAEMEALSRADQALHRSIVIDDVYRAMIDLAVDLLGADRSMFLTFNSRGLLHAHAARGVPEAELAGLQDVYHRITRETLPAQTEEPRVMEDVQGSARLYPGVRGVTTSASSVDIPVFVGGAFFGIFVLGYSRRRAFSEDDRRLFRTLAGRASLAIQNALLFEESQRRARELEALHRADEALNRSLALDDVLAAMTDLAIDLLGANSSLVASFGDDDRLHVAISRDLDGPTLAALELSYSRFSRSVFDRRLAEARTGLTENVHTDPRTHDGLRGLGVGSAAEIPVVVDGRLWGLFSIGWSEPRQFSDGEQRMFDAFSARASLAIQNALLFDESQRRAREMEALYRADAALHQSLAIEDVLGAMTDLAVDLLGADSSLVASFGEDGHLDVAVQRGLTPGIMDLIRSGYRNFDRAHFARLQQPVRTGLIEDVHSNPRVDERLRNRTVGSLAEIPVFVGGELWGIFSIGWGRVRRFSDADRQMFDAFSARASLAIQNALLFEQAQLTASLEERQRIARELHDSVSQALYGIGLGARTLRRRLGDQSDPLVSEPLEYIANLAEGGLAETRALIFELIPNSIETDGLASALQRQAAAAQARSGLPIEVRLCDEPEIPVRAKEALYRIAQESLGNVVKHAGASLASLSLADVDGAIVLRITDNGRGFDPEGEFPGHFGLRSMAERARKVGGEYTVQSAPGAGSTVTVRVPRPA